MSNPVSVSYSGASKFKACPTKFYLSKKYNDKRISSAFPFGKSVEMGVSAMLEGKELADAVQAFEKHWNEEHVFGNEYRQVFDNLDLAFYASDFDKNLFVNAEAEAVLDQWAEELLEERTRSWLEVFEEIQEKVKARNVEDAQLAFHNRVIWECCRIRGRVMLEAFYYDILPQIDITRKEHFASQKKISMKNTDGDEVSGYVDYVVFHKEAGWIILDLKTAAAPYDRHKLDSSEQLRVYAAALGEEIGSNKAGYVVLLKKIKIDRVCNKCNSPREGLAKKCKKCGEGEYNSCTLRGETQLIWKEYASEELEELLEDYMNVAVAIKNNVNYRNPESCMAYGRQCEFYQHCWGKKKLEEIEHLEAKGEKK